MQFHAWNAPSSRIMKENEWCKNVFMFFPKELLSPTELENCLFLQFVYVELVCMRSTYLVFSKPIFNNLRSVFNTGSNWYLQCSSGSLFGINSVLGKYFSGVLNSETLSLRCKKSTRFFESAFQFIKFLTKNSWSSNRRSANER